MLSLTLNLTMLVAQMTHPSQQDKTPAMFFTGSWLVYIVAPVWPPPWRPANGRITAIRRN